MDKWKIATAAVVVVGGISLALCAKFGVDKEVIAGIASVLLILAGSMKSMLFSNKPE